MELQKKACRDILPQEYLTKILRRTLDMAKRRNVIETKRRQALYL